MKRLVICMLILIMGVSIFGCSKTGGEDKSVLKSLKREGIVDKDYELIDEVTEINTVNFRTEYTYSIYENDDGELIAIFYDEDNADADYEYLIRIFSKVTYEEKEEIDEDSYYDFYCEYSDGRKTEENEYDMTDVTVYYAYKKESFLGVSYTFEEEEK